MLLFSVGPKADSLNVHSNCLSDFEERVESIDLLKHAIENELELCEEAVEVDVCKKKDRFSCSICNFVPKFPRDLVRHMRKHTGRVKKYSNTVQIFSVLMKPCLSIRY